MNHLLSIDKWLIHHLLSNNAAMADVGEQFISTGSNAVFLTYKSIYNVLNDCIFILC